MTSGSIAFSPGKCVYLRGKERAMGEIRSALDIAMEKTRDIKGDKSGAEHRELRNEGKRAATAYLDGSGEAELAKEAKARAGNEAAMFREGAVSVLLAALRLPATEAETGRAELIGKGLEALVPKAGMAELFAQVAQILAQFLSERKRMEEALRQQFLPRLRARQQELARMYGQEVPLDAAHDPEYLAALSKNRNALEARYEQVLDEARARAREAAGIAEERE